MFHYFRVQLLLTIYNYDLLLGVRENYQLDGGFDNYFDGIIDEIKIYDIALNDCDVLVLYNEGTLNYPILEEVQISQNNNMLRANLYASTYYWYLDGVLLEGLDSQEIEIIQNGVYQVQLEQNDCISKLWELFFLSTEELTNPCTKFIQVDNYSEYIIQKLTLYNVSGSIVKIENSRKIIFNTTVSNVLYLLEIELENKQLIYKQLVLN